MVFRTFRALNSSYVVECTPFTNCFGGNAIFFSISFIEAFPSSHSKSLFSFSSFLRTIFQSWKNSPRQTDFLFHLSILRRAYHLILISYTDTPANSPKSQLPAAIPHRHSFPSLSSAQALCPLIVSRLRRRFRCLGLLPWS